MYVCLSLLLIHSMLVSVNYKQEELKFWEGGSCNAIYLCLN